MGRANSIMFRKLLRCCHELGLDYERIDAGNNFGVADTPKYLATCATGCPLRMSGLLDFNIERVIQNWRFS